MSEIILQLIILVSIGVATLAIIWMGKRFVAQNRQQQVPNVVVPTHTKTYNQEPDTSLPRVRILSFSSEDCQQCRQLQAPVLRRVVEACGDKVSVTTIDAFNSPELTQRYQVLTVPTTVLLDTRGKAHSVNHGFTNAQSLLKQVDEILAMDEYAQACK